MQYWNMKTSRFSFVVIFGFLAVMSASLTGCDRRPLEPAEPQPEPAPVVEPIPGAPEVDNACRVVITSRISRIRSFAFSEGGLYQVVFKTGEIVSGSYSYEDATYLLDGFGSLHVYLTKGEAFSEMESSVIFTDAEGKETIYGCIIQRNMNNRNPLFRSWEIAKTVLSVGEYQETSIDGLAFNALRWELGVRGVQRDDIPPDVDLRCVDVFGTGELTAVFKFEGENALRPAFVGQWSDIEPTAKTILLDWKDTFMKFMEKDKAAGPFVLHYAYDSFKDVLTISFLVKGKDNKDNDIEINCSLMFIPNEKRLTINP